MQLAVNVRIRQWTREISYNVILACQIVRLSYGCLDWSATTDYVFRFIKDTVVIVVHGQQPQCVHTGSVRPSKIVKCICMSRKIFSPKSARRPSVESAVVTGAYFIIYPMMIVLIRIHSHKIEYKKKNKLLLFKHSFSKIYITNKRIEKK